MIHFFFFFSNIITCEIRKGEFEEAIAEDQGVLRVASHTRNCSTETQKGKKEKYHISVLLICFMVHPSFVQPLKINNCPNFDNLSLPR